MNVYLEETALLEEWNRKLQKLIQERDELSVYIRENELMEESMKESKDDNYQLFSPRQSAASSDRFEKLQEDGKKLYERKEEIQKEIRFFEESIHCLQMKSDMADTRKVLSDSMNLEMISFQEEDRKRIAGELHDTSLQHLTYLIHKLELCSLYIDQDPIRAKLEIGLVRQDIKKIIDGIRASIFDLRPMAFDDIGFKEALVQLIEEKNSSSQMILDIDIDSVSCENNALLLNIYRIVQEALNNIIKHSHANKVWVHLKAKEKANSYYLFIKDDGSGFQVTENQECICEKGNHFGLFFIRERAKLLNGTLQVQSSIGDGTELRIDFQL